MRTNGDQWNITSSVGRTALLVALGRSLESRSESALFSDPFAAEFVADSGELDLAPARFEQARDDGDDEEVQRSVDLLQSMMAARTRRIDVALTEANRSGIDQIVILAAGLDARAHRLDWAPGTTVFEVDQPAVLEFKDRTLDRVGAEPKATRVTVACDLREDWLTALRDAGLDTSRPTVWAAEGLLPYLLAADQQRLLTTVGSASPTGSTLVLDAPRPPFDPALISMMNTEAFGVDIEELFLDGDGDFAAQGWLDDNGWATTSDSVGALLTSYGRTSEAFTQRPLDPDATTGTPAGDAFDIVVAQRR